MIQSPLQVLIITNLIITNLISGYAVSDYRKLNSHIVTAMQVKADGSLGKVISNYPLPTIDNLLARLDRCKFFSTIDVRSGYYHIQLTKEAAE